MINQTLIEQGIRLVLKGLGCKMTDQNFLDTPERYARAMVEMFSPPDIDYPTFEETYSDFVLLRGHKLWSLCPHHLFPVHFSVDLAYVPNGEVLGLSKLARLLHDINRGPLLQEKFTLDAIQKVKEILPNVRGVACKVEGEHGCAKMRGVHTSASFMTYNFYGSFKEAVNEQRFFELTRR